MKNFKQTTRIAKKICTIITLVFGIWLVASWLDIVGDNMLPNPHHSQYNFFVLVTEWADEISNSDTVRATVVDINEKDNIVTFIDDSGDFWHAEVKDASKYNKTTFYEIRFNTMGTDDPYDDEIKTILEKI